MTKHSGWKRKAFTLLTFCIVSVMIATAAFVPVPASAAAPTDAQITAYAKKLVKGMSTNRKVAQLMIVAMPTKKPITKQKTYQFGGYILFGYHFKDTTRTKFKTRMKKLQNVSKKKMLICVDEEGGTVVRASYYKKFRKNRFQSPRRTYQLYGYSGITYYTKKKDAFLKNLYINTNLAPVVDVPYKSSNFMYKRAFSTNSSSVSKFTKRTIKQMKTDNVVSCMKHFPGYGGNGDTHGQIIRDKRKLATFVKRDLKPFQTGIDNGADMIMVSHTIVNAFDSKRPASLSKNVHTYIRKNMDFDGVIVTDGLAMKGIMNFVDGNSGKAAVRAINAGNDMLRVTGNYLTVYKSLKAAAKSGKISESRLNKSVQRVLEMKIRRGIIKIPN